MKQLDLNFDKKPIAEPTKKEKQKKARNIIRTYHKFSDCIADKHVAKAQVKILKNKKSKR